MAVDLRPDLTTHETRVDFARTLNTRQGRQALALEFNQSHLSLRAATRLAGMNDHHALFSSYTFGFSGAAGIIATGILSPVATLFAAACVLSGVGMGALLAADFDPRNQTYNKVARYAFSTLAGAALAGGCIVAGLATATTLIVPAIGLLPFTIRSAYIALSEFHHAHRIAEEGRTQFLNAHATLLANI